MQFSRFATISLVAALAEACSQCVHPGNFTGGLSVYWNTTVICTSVLPAIAASVPAHFWDPRDEAPCLMQINVTNPTSGKSVIATVVSQEASTIGDAILLTVPGMAALAPDANPNHAPAFVEWTFLG